MSATAYRPLEDCRTLSGGHADIGASWLIPSKATGKAGQRHLIKSMALR